MTSRDFVYWLQGFMEINDPKTLTKEQALIIQRHLRMVFAHEIDPSMPDKRLYDIHEGKEDLKIIEDDGDKLDGDDKDNITGSILKSIVHRTSVLSRKVMC